MLSTLSIEASGVLRRVNNAKAGAHVLGHRQLAAPEIPHAGSAALRPFGRLDHHFLEVARTTRLAALVRVRVVARSPAVGGTAMGQGDT
jgi:hypothetical protein